ncbi:MULTISPECIES: hypothetical protein [Enterococcus]|jgi:hypothetical protein|uniref:Uncharacterized protein n=1 Tax=Enterococcus cecorum TaxID=44008 RepID=A0A366SKE3_9ENTE|nr:MULTISPECIES: hypothetical protein [Enterococcus]MDK2844741.1 hypothetical protein [Enterococcus sp.]NLL32114.1 hypothetical protein [Enterococcus cecorum]RBR28161.1 hypothetical protein EB08_01859 [Enterococcus cecorum]RBR29598.1 hypothetical protein EB18_01384 [Enterococcus cecorum]RBR31173.1 hypothetical protein EB06_01455 [Enterococcus cecorum]
MKWIALNEVISAFIGVILGAVIVLITNSLRVRYDEARQVKMRMLEHKVKEIELLVLLNKKIRELLEKRVMMMDKYVSFDAFDDCYITIDDYVYLQSFASSNSFYLPNHILDEFFQKIATRKVVLTPEETVQFGAYAYKGGRVVLEQFSDELTELIYERKIQMKQLTDKPLAYFSKTL